MKRPGLTEAQRKGLECVRVGSIQFSLAIRQWMFDGGYARDSTPEEWDADQIVIRLTPRGQAALAAPRVTAAELAMLERLESWEGTIHGRDVTIAKSLRKKGLALCGFGSSGYRRAKITPAGTTALNNIRAASGSPDYKEN